MKHNWVDCQTLRLLVRGSKNGRGGLLLGSTEGERALKDWLMVKKMMGGLSDLCRVSHLLRHGERRPGNSKLWYDTRVHHRENHLWNEWQPH